MVIFRYRIEKAGMHGGCRPPSPAIPGLRKALPARRRIPLSHLRQPVVIIFLPLLCTVLRPSLRTMDWTAWGLPLSQFSTRGLLRGPIRRLRIFRIIWRASSSAYLFSTACARRFRSTLAKFTFAVSEIAALSEIASPVKPSA